MYEELKGRVEACAEMVLLIEESRNGEIALADFVERLETITKTARTALNNLA